MALEDPRHPDAERLAEYADGVLDATARAEVQQHLADCDDCRFVVMETMAYLETAPALTNSVLPDNVIRLPRQKWVTGLAGTLAVAATLLLAVRITHPARLFGRPDVRPELRELVAAVALEPTRPVEGRLTGGFKYAPPPSPTRGSGDRELSPDVRIAAAKIEKSAQSDSAPETLRAWGVAQLLLGKSDEAIRDLEDAAAGRPGDASIDADLAAAYLARARGGSAEDWPRALDAAERAIHKQPSLLEPYYTRAVVVEQLRLDAVKAWREYLERDSSSDWAREARRRLEAAEKSQRISDRSRIERDLRDAVSRSDADAEMQSVVADPQRVREYLEEDLTATWGRAVLAGDESGAAAALGNAVSLSRVYAQYASDALPADLVRHLGEARSPSSRRALALAVVDYSNAARLVGEDRLHDAEAILARTLPGLEAQGSPLGYWADYFLVLPMAQRGELEQSLTRLAALDAVCERRSYTALCGTVSNRIGQIHTRRGDLERAVSDRQRAIAYFDRAKDEDQVAVMHSQISEDYRFLADPTQAWSHHVQALYRLPATHNFRSRHLVLVQAGITSTYQGAHESALWFQRAVMDNGRLWGRASATSTGLFHMARNLARLGRSDAALSMVNEARMAVAQIPDPPFRERFELELLEVEAEIFGARNPREGIPVLDRAIARFDETGFGLRLAALLLSRGRLYERASDRTAAERDWSTGVARLEAERRSLTAEELRLSQAGTLRDMWSAVAMSRVRAKASAVESLDAVEQSHARTLVEHALSRHVNLTPASQWLQELPPASGVLYFLIYEHAAMGWLMTSKGVVEHPLAASPDAISAIVHRYRRVVDSMGSDDAFRLVSMQMHGVLLAPFASELRDLASVVVVPDPLLAGISFASLVDPRTGHFLIADHAVAMAPSGSLLVKHGPSRIGGPALIVSANAASGLAPLPWVAEEVRQITSLHPRAFLLDGDAVTKARVLSELSDADVVHFAGHAIGNSTNPLLSRLVLNAGAEGGSDLYAYELLAGRDLAASLVVLAACRSGYSARGADDDGVLALARPFLARGARAVVASLWDVADRHSVPLMTRLHRRLNTQPPPAAWRDAVLEAIAAGEPVLAGWGAYALFLGRDGLSARPHAAERSKTGETQ